MSLAHSLVSLASDTLAGQVLLVRDCCKACLTRPVCGMAYASTFRSPTLQFVNQF